MYYDYASRREMLDQKSKSFELEAAPYIPPRIQIRDVTAPKKRLRHPGVVIRRDWLRVDVATCWCLGKLFILSGKA